MHNKLVVKFSIHRDGEVLAFAVRGQTAKALLALVDAGPAGCTAAEVANWAYRFAAYCHELRREFGLAIRTDREAHAGGWHGRHVLETAVRVFSVEGEGANRRAAA